MSQGAKSLNDWIEEIDLNPYFLPDNIPFAYICPCMAKEKNKPVPVRFNLKLLEVLKEEEKIETPQQALNFLSDFWENNRPAKEGFASELGETKSSTPSIQPSIKERKSEKKDEVTGAPAGLSGIDLSIWKAEQKEKK